MTKLIKTYTACLVIMFGVFILQSCDKNFEEINTNPNAVSTVVPQFVFTKAQYDGASNMLPLFLGHMQYTTSYNDVAGFGSKYVTNQSSQTAAAFSRAYPNEINEIGIVIKAVKDDAGKVNMLAAAKIWRVYCFSRLTDLYGDIPYFQAGLGYDSTLYKPAYDPQKDIYANLLAELESAVQIFDASKTTFGTSDLMYGGNIDKWKKFAYSLMLRLGMRMTKVDAALARTWVTKAIAGGVIMQDGDIAKIAYIGTGQDINKNPLVFNLWNSDYIAQNGSTNTEGGKYQDVFINYLKSTKDPRLPVFSVVWVNGAPSTDTAIQKGMPATFINIKPSNFVTYSEPNPKTVLLMGSPLLLYTAAESYFLLAEAALRGWYTGATASSLYRNGIEAAMRQWAIIAGSAGEIATTDINNYVANNSLNTGGTFDQQMQQIYTQFWVSIFPDGQEVFATFRRTGYPALVPNNYPGNATGGKFFRRGLYPLSEQNLNAESYKAAVSRQGSDEFLTRIWWDK
ncbi:SusD/RagB family nutrient-binding outer membrane lipoprotein [Niastella caeni]|uniref:SusD/RagB family nutrient-binding outer membrane lipoprotein n=1 Tax=Niastella caeni TaxID=2569763 RepID=A0A4S8HZ74_9BACT|nr:SusD/RagB family nutrient-binding outer membrane lipoprotein [Niastella caeni]THU41113.1 SusD/RagB family nutrient-binding outer membrane lipoprotein [Niastella caeni]